MSQGGEYINTADRLEWVRDSSDAWQPRPFEDRLAGWGWGKFRDAQNFSDGTWHNPTGAVVNFRKVREDTKIMVEGHLTGWAGFNNAIYTSVWISGGTKDLPYTEPLPGEWIGGYHWTNFGNAMHFVMPLSYMYPATVHKGSRQAQLCFRIRNHDVGGTFFYDTQDSWNMAVWEVGG